MGYAAHIATDLTIHPVVEMHVGVYAENKTAHRTCEMHQDAFIWRTRNLGDMGVADYFRICIGKCSDQDGSINPAIAELWTGALQATYPKQFAAVSPDISKWHHGFRKVLDIVDDVGALIPFTRHLLASEGTAYPAYEDIDQSYIAELRTPEGIQSYATVFDRAVGSVVSIWSLIGNALTAKSNADAEAVLQSIPDGDLDTGTRLGTSEYIFWKGLRNVQA